MPLAIAGAVMAAMAATQYNRTCSAKETARGAATCDAAQPAWVALFSTAAAGPEQLFLNHGPTPDTMVVGWATAEPGASVVEYGLAPDQLTQSASGDSGETYVYGSYESPYLHHVTLAGLSGRTVYYYHVGDGDGEWSDVRSFTSNAVGADTYPYLLGVFGDIGESANAVKTITTMVASDCDSYLMAGDMSYASGCESKGCTTWDAFQRMLEPLSDNKAIMVELGNHDYDDYNEGIEGFSSKKRFSGMPGDLDFFSTEMGPLHVVSLASFYSGGFGANSAMTQWLKADLAAIDRVVTPWVGIMVHAPHYNSNTQHTNDGNSMRAAYEQLFNDYGVSFVVAGHVHAFERSYPTAYGEIVAAGEAPTYFTLGDAGASLYTKWIALPNWSAYRSAEFGHGQFLFVNNTVCEFTWIRNVDAKVADSVAVFNTKPY